MAAPRPKAIASKNVEMQPEVPCTQKRRASAKKNVQILTEIPLQHASAQVCGCRECQGLAFAMQGDGDSACVRCKVLNNILSLVVDLKEEVERLSSIRECERETDWWCQSPWALRFGSQLRLHVKHISPYRLTNR